MTLTDLLAELHARRIRIEVVDGRMRVDAPVGALSAGLRAALLEHKAALLARDESTSAPMPPSAPVAPTSSKASAMRIPLDDLVYGDYLVRHKLRIVGGTAYPDGRTYRPTIYLADDAG
jgi:hypothetical protein